mmetsp:Transcript_7922/g.12133  ORF Transcript_7922/g.12133 Transcript_7922/m.12133 type:complete len:111 (-) Transcript_7922:326-658(-)
MAMTVENFKRMECDGNQINHSDIVWCLYNRIYCRSCNTGASTKISAKMPTLVVARFPFNTTATGPRIHQSMIHALNAMKTKQISIGCYAEMINEMLQSEYDCSRYGYLAT